jgi:Protein of unknown function (DUF3224)
MKHVIIVFGLTLAGLIMAREGMASTQKESSVTARGTFDVKLVPQPADSTGGPFGRLLFDKQFHGDLEATSKGQMLGAYTAVEGSAGYVAMELVTGVLNGKQGSFILLHKGTMQKGVYVMDVTVVPDSGTEQLTGIAGAMKIIIEGDKHSYQFEYTIGGQ